MNCDSRKHQVASLQVHLARIANEVALHFDQAKAIERVLARDDLSEGHRSLAETARSKGVTGFAAFFDAGYRGMYNMSAEQLKTYKGVPASEKLLDRMDTAELAANLFRVTQTDQSMKRSGEWGQWWAEDTAMRVGAKVRQTMIELSETAPEDLPPAPENVVDLRKKLGGHSERLRDYDKVPLTKRLVNTLPETPDDPADPGYTPDPEESEDL